ncbi:hypothetical protein WR25_23324 [Diploscapter pachys]|uniref:Uncharacterized protein n=1 Tax=Diploscapter pachys TaxID=2018661 RepID=A0A2A2LKE7_9BILA|nr:hypothetical protein WR25_23324 [Diploscapter pachys]
MSLPMPTFFSPCGCGGGSSYSGYGSSYGGSSYGGQSFSSYPMSSYASGPYYGSYSSGPSKSQPTYNILPNLPYPSGGGYQSGPEPVPSGSYQTEQASGSASVPETSNPVPVQPTMISSSAQTDNSVGPSTEFEQSSVQGPAPVQPSVTTFEGTATSFPAPQGETEGDEIGGGNQIAGQDTGSFGGDDASRTTVIPGQPIRIIPGKGRPEGGAQPEEIPGTVVETSGIPNGSGTPVTPEGTGTTQTEVLPAGNVAEPEDSVDVDQGKDGGDGKDGNKFDYYYVYYDDKGKPVGKAKAKPGPTTIAPFNPGPNFTTAAPIQSDHNKEEAPNGDDYHEASPDNTGDEKATSSTDSNNKNYQSIKAKTSIKDDNTIARSINNLVNLNHVNRTRKESYSKGGAIRTTASIPLTQAYSTNYSTMMNDSAMHQGEFYAKFIESKGIDYEVQMEASKFGYRDFVDDNPTTLVSAETPKTIVRKSAAKRMIMPTQIAIPYYKVEDAFDVYDCPPSLNDNEVIDVTKSDFTTDSDLLNNKPNKQSRNLQKRNCNPRMTIEVPMATTERFAKIPKTYNEQKRLEKQTELSRYRTDRKRRPVNKKHIKKNVKKHARKNAKKHLHWN